MWGGVSDSKLNRIFPIQKHCVRVLLGEHESYLDKFKICVRVRQVDHEGKLGAEFQNSNNQLFVTLS